jgi:hypothetical protein
MAAMTPDKGMTKPYKTCSCQKAYSRESFDALPGPGDWNVGDGEILRLRNCTCGSTIAVQIAPPRESSTPPPF